MSGKAMTLREAMAYAFRYMDPACTEPVVTNEVRDEAAATLRRWMPFVEAAVREGRNDSIAVLGELYRAATKEGE